MSGPIFTSYAQNLEDILLWRALRHVRSGCYIDVGAHDPRLESVSRGFYEQGWRGVHFEPNPVFAAKIRQDRPDEIVHEVAVSDTEGTVRFAVTTASGLSTGAVEYAEAYRRSDQVVEELDVRTTTLQEACGPLAGRDVHWLKIDVEGMEEQVLRGWDPRTLRPWIVMVEATRPGSTAPSHEAWEQLLLSADYRFVFFDGLNRFSIAAERPELAAAFSAPVNIHDLAGGCEIGDSSPFVAGAVGRRDAVIARMRSSRSWRWTRPLRRLVGLVTRGVECDDR
jgi:FkbM family methyltransferase